MQRSRHEDWRCIMSAKNKREKAAKETGIGAGTLKIGEMAIEKAIRGGVCIQEAQLLGMAAIEDEMVRQVAKQRNATEDEIRAMVDQRVADRVAN